MVIRLTLALLLLAGAAAAQTTVTETIQQDSDDCGNGGGGFTTDASWFYMGVYGGAELKGGYRFQTVALPNGATISTATLKVVSDNNDADDITIRCYAEDTSDATTFTDETDFDARTRTSSSDVTNWTTDVSTGDTISLDCTDAVQEVVNRGDWSSGNDLAILWVSETGGWTTAQSVYDYATAESVLEVTYQTATDGPNVRLQKVILLRGHIR